MIIPHRSDYDPVLDAVMTTGVDTARAVDQLPAGSDVAMDTETPSIIDSFTIKCVTAAWRRLDGRVESVLLDPLRNPADLVLCRLIVKRAGNLILHNAAFDIPGLYAAGIVTEDDIMTKVLDTLVLARMAYPDTLDRKSLGALAKRHLGMNELAGGMELAFKAAGFKTKAEGFEKMDIDSPVYRFGAMADTIVTLRLWPLLMADAVKLLTDHPFSNYGLADSGAAAGIIWREQRVNQVMMRRSAIGLAVDKNYLQTYGTKVEDERDLAEISLAEAGIRPGNGNDLVNLLSETGGLPATWPKTATGKLSYAKANLESLDHPLAAAHRDLAHSTKILGYLEKVTERAKWTGRCHPQVAVLGASATGRMSYSHPELQQFPEEARPIICDDGQGLTSLDWSQIEPVTLANMARDHGFLAPFENGADLYEPIQQAAGIPRKVAKVVLLATMYGQGVAALAATIGHSQDSAMQIKRQMLAAMPESSKHMARISTIADTYGVALTVSGRILPIPRIPGGGYMAHKAVNYTVQGSAYDILAETIVECERQGIGKHIQLAMHDELVVDTEAADAIQEIMRKPPQALINWAGRVPVLRTDRADLGHSWQAA